MSYLHMDASVALLAMQSHVRSVNEANGWFEATRSFGDDIALLHSEVSEAFEAYRDHGLADGTSADVAFATGNLVPKPEGVGSELADVFIRLLDTCDRTGIDLYAEFARKMVYNTTRGYRHGGKRV